MLRINIKGKMHSIPQCPKCDTPMGLEVTKKQAIWICPTHGAQQWIDKQRLNGCYDLAKVGGTGD